MLCRKSTASWRLPQTFDLSSTQKSYYVPKFLVVTPSQIYKLLLTFPPDPIFFHHCCYQSAHDVCIQSSMPPFIDIRCAIESSDLWILHGNNPMQNSQVWRDCTQGPTIECYFPPFCKLYRTRSSAIAEVPRDASCQLKSCQLPRNSAETTYTTSPDQIDGMKLEI